MTTSLKVAEVFGKEHKHILRDIQKLDCDEDFRESNFGLSVFKVPNNNKNYPMYEITKDGFTFLAMGFTGSKAAQFKQKYIEAFNRLEEQVKRTLHKLAEEEENELERTFSC